MSRHVRNVMNMLLEIPAIFQGVLTSPSLSTHCTTSKVDLLLLDSAPQPPTERSWMPYAPGLENLIGTVGTFYGRLTCWIFLSFYCVTARAQLALPTLAASVPRGGHENIKPTVQKVSREKGV